MLDALTADDFRAHVGEAHRLVAEDGEALDTVLAEVKDLGAAGEHRAPFSVVFRAALDAEAPQGTFTVEREGADALALFIVPIGPAAGGEGMLYEAVFA